VVRPSWWSLSSQICECGIEKHDYLSLQNIKAREECHETIRGVLKPLNINTTSRISAANMLVILHHF
ncbi:hypothetical protein KUCAC02_033974, partial [Chaenocephalus aceratus]